MVGGGGVPPHFKWGGGGVSAKNLEKRGPKSEKGVLFFAAQRRIFLKTALAERQFRVAGMATWGLAFSLQNTDDFARGAHPGDMTSRESDPMQAHASGAHNV